MQIIDINNLTPQNIFPTKDLIRIYIELADGYEEEQAYQNEILEHKLRMLRWENRLKVPFGHSKKFYKALLDETKLIIKQEKERWRQSARQPIIQAFAKANLDDYIEKEEKIKSALKGLENKSNMNQPLNIEQAKQYPMDRLIDISRGNVTRCLWHEDKNPSMHYYKKTNHLFCFVCNKKADSIDVAMKLYNKTFPEAVKQLTS